MDRDQLIKNVKKWPRKPGKADYLRFLNDEILTRAEAIKATCYECVQGEDTRPCLDKTCPLRDFCQWGRGEDTKK